MTNSIIYDSRTLNTSVLPEISDIEIIGAANGTLVAVWTDEDGTAFDNSGSALVVRVFDAFGNPLIPEGQANVAQTLGDQFDSDLVALSDGGAAFVYTSSSNVTGSSTDIWFERRDAAGQIVNNGAIEIASTEDSNAVVTEFGSSGLLVAYQSDDGTDSGLFAKVVDANGNVSSRIIVDDQFDNQFSPAVDTLANGLAAIAYLDQSGTNTSLVRVALIDPSFNGGVGNFIITPTPAQVNAVDIAALSNGNFVVVWEEVTASGRNAFYEVRDSGGTVVKSKSEVFSITADERYQPAIEATENGFVILTLANDVNPNSNTSFEFRDLSYFDNDGQFQTGRGSGGQFNAAHDLSITADDRAVRVEFSNFGLGPEIRTGLIDDYRDEVVGTPDNDTLVANRFGDVDVSGGAGDDLLYSLDGDDAMFGEAGNDVIIGSGGDDLINGGEGFDTLDYTDLRWAIVLGSQGLIDKNGLGTDTLASLASAGGLTNSIERIVGDTGFLQQGNNTIDGGNSSDSTFDVDLQLESLTIQLSASSPIVGDRLDFEVVNFTDVLGTANNDFISGDAQNNLLVGGDGSDTLNGRAGADTMVGGLGDDVYVVESVGDVVTELAGQGIDFVATTITYNVPVNVEILQLQGTANINSTGTAAGDIIQGNSGDNIIDGAGGIDVMQGGEGNDTYAVDNSFDAVIEAAAGGFDTVYSSVDYIIDAAQEIESAILTGNAVTLRGSDSDNQLFGNAQVNVIDGRGGTDYMLGLGGADIFQINLEPGAVDVVGDFSKAEGDRLAFTGFNQATTFVNQASATSFEVRDTKGTADFSDDIVQTFILNDSYGSGTYTQGALVFGVDYYFG